MARGELRKRSLEMKRSYNGEARVLNVSATQFQVTKNCDGNNIWEEESEKAGRGTQHDNVDGIVSCHMLQSSSGF